ncbi:uncharacterized protein [Pyxicephalus adspersus]|uniref:uncharacterized protein n=1 Tax=Pyxicephalus adspersus TaxID=30357 RepID=UPI003B5994AC
MEHGMKIFILLTLWMFAVRTAYCSSIFKELSSINLADKTGKHDQILIEEPGMIDLNIQILVPNSQIGVTEITSAMSFMRELYPYLIKVISVKNETYCGDIIDTNVCTSAPELSVLLYAVVNDETTYTYSVNLTLQTLWLNIDLFGGFSITPIYFTQYEETVVFINFDYSEAYAIPYIYYSYNSSVASVYLQVASAPCKQTLVQQIPESFYSSQENVEETRNLDLAVSVEPGNIDLKIMVVVPMIQRGNIEIASPIIDTSELHPLLIPIKTTDYCGGNANLNPCTLPGPVLTLQLEAWVEVRLNPSMNPSMNLSMNHRIEHSMNPSMNHRI